MAAVVQDLAVVRDGGLHRYFHAGQRKAHVSTKRFVLVLAGTQSGKTSYGPHWLLQEMQRKGPGDYLIATPTFPLLEVKLLPEFRKLFETQMELGEYRSSPPPRRFTLSPVGEVALWGARQAVPTQVFFGYAADPDSLESATLKAAWLDEAGQKSFKLGSWEAIQRRLSLNEGRVLITTTPYTLGWLKTELHDKAGLSGSDVELVNFASTANPQFPHDEFERARRSLPAWKFNMFYRGIFERPAGIIFDCWDRRSNVIPHMDIPTHWERFLGLDFGGVNTCGLFLAKELNDAGEATGRYIGYREYLAGSKTAAGHARELLRGEPRLPTAVGGARSEGQWRDEFGAAGLGVQPPVVSEVEVGIDRMYAMIAPNDDGLRQFVVLDSLTGFLDQVTDYSREMDENGEPTEKIEDKETYHYLDAGRYILSYIADPPPEYFIW